MNELTRTEHWLPVAGWEGFYEVSDQGRVRSIDRTIATDSGYLRHYRRHMLSPRPGGSDNGYLYVTLMKPGTRVTRAVHGLVLAAFDGPPEGREYLHGAGGPGDNRWPENLSYGRIGYQGRKKVKLTAQQVREIRNLAASGFSQRVIACAYHVHFGTVSDIVRRRSWALLE